MPVYLINGASGTGKTTIGRELEKRGFRVIDTDKSFGYFANLGTEEPVEYPKRDPDAKWYEINGWIWNRKKVEKILEEGTHETIFLCGGSLNDDIFYHKMAAIFRLYTSPEILKKRLLTYENAKYTNSPAFVERMLDLVKRSKADAKMMSWYIIDTSNNTVEQSVNEIFRNIHDN